MSKQLYDQISGTLRRAELANQHYQTESLKWNLDPHKSAHQEMRAALKEIYEIRIPLRIVSIMKAIALPGLNQLILHEVLHPELHIAQPAYGVTPTLYHLEEYKPIWLQQLGAQEKPELIHYINDLRRYVLQFENLLGDLEESVTS
ncbi:hypothetical protein QG516_11390 [Pedobacter gandavensis]|uniref:hypothetical protein n=1 Tax=Pedobacter gandavensis TaxID=2679963 RepID=UPI00247928BB|nr:hypothetical protein [Pedobacter gandavensis]WGQ12240.1 hypothetical protein QG516_11390 [Pedobacter gandavensis]